MIGLPREFAATGPRGSNVDAVRSYHANRYEAKAWKRIEPLVHMSKKAPYKTLVATWGNDEVIVELNLEKDQWAKIVRGDRVEIQGRGYWYDGDEFQDIWDFNSGLHDAELIVQYGQTSIGDFSGQGYIGPISDVLINEGN